MKNQLFLLILTGTILGCGNGAPGKQKPGSEPESTLEVPSTQPSDAEYKEMGLRYAMAVQGALGKTLQGKMQESGPLEAIDYCNLNALLITDSIGQSLGAEIRRITDRPRNPLNKASDVEKEFIREFREQRAPGTAPEPLLIRQDSLTYCYYPILTNDLCLQCHGSPGMTIKPEVYEKIKLLYPEDQAIAYSANEIRGLWKVAFTVKQP